MNIPRYTVQYSREAERFLDDLRDRKLYRRLRETADALANDPRPYNCKRLQGSWHDCLMVRVSDCRIIYRVVDRELVVLVVEIGDRREVYH